MIVSNSEVDRVSSIRVGWYRQPESDSDTQSGLSEIDTCKGRTPICVFGIFFARNAWKRLTRFSVHLGLPELAQYVCVRDRDGSTLAAKAYLGDRPANALLGLDDVTWERRVNTYTVAVSAERRCIVVVNCLSEPDSRPLVNPTQCFPSHTPELSLSPFGRHSNGTMQ